MGLAGGPPGAVRPGGGECLELSVLALVGRDLRTVPLIVLGIGIARREHVEAGMRVAERR